MRDVSTPGEVAQFRADAAAAGDVIAFSPDGEVHALAQSESWGFTDSGFRNAWAVDPPSTGAPVRVAVIDTGVDASHPDLTAAVGSDPYPGMDFVNLCTDSSNHEVPTPGVTTDPNGHGTHVSGIIAAADDSQGVVGGAPGVTIVPVRVLDSSGSGSWSAVAAGILWAADKTGGNASVISMSLGGSSDPGGVISATINTVMTDPQYTHPVIVVAAGNFGNSSNPLYPAVYASTYSQVLSVAALCKPGFFLSPRRSDECSSGSTIASFSSKAWNGSGLATGVSAPGTSILSDWPGGGTAVESGTSMATPFVAALAALVVSRCPADSASQVVGRLESTANDLGPAGPDMQYGYGRIDPTTAVASC